MVPGPHSSPRRLADDLGGEQRGVQAHLRARGLRAGRARDPVQRALLGLVAGRRERVFLARARVGLGEPVVRGLSKKKKPK